ncbi:MAG: helix-turn-helix transcriptional regulator [Gammaproteobacteria bacterium]|nr:helix-turn-helix transcriptional regulator [Gammaproteobacteria bacterium]
MSSFKKEFGQQIKRLRARIHITQDQLAERLGISRDMVKYYERGDNGPEFERIPAIAKALEVTKSELFDF